MNRLCVFLLLVLSCTIVNDINNDLILQIKQRLDPGIRIVVPLLQVITQIASFLPSSQISQKTPQTFPVESTPSSASSSMTRGSSWVEWTKVPLNTLKLVAAEEEHALEAAIIPPGRNER